MTKHRSFTACAWLLLGVALLYSHRTCVRAQTSANFGYDFSAVQLITQLDDELQEISGLGYDEMGNDELLAVEDERGKVYRLNARSGRILWSVDFWKDGDYEGVEMVGGTVWVVKSTGTLYHITHLGEPHQAVEKFNTHLTSDNDVEGLAYDRAGNRLLLACKADVRDDGNSKEGRYIYAFDLSTNTLSDQPVIAIQQQAVREHLGTCPLTATYAKLRDFFVERDEYRLAPSAIAVHPTTGRIFLASSAGKVLMVLSPDGQIEHLERLDKDLLPQPEGLAFGTDGSLYISTEAKKGEPARLYRVPQTAR